VRRSRVQLRSVAMDQPSGPAEVPFFTATAVNFQAHAWALRISFGDAATADAESKIVKEIFKCAIGIPWPLAKVVHHYIGLAIAAYEKQEGEISVPRTVATQMAEHAKNQTVG